MSDDLTELSPTERGHLRDLAKSWSSYGPALREWSSLDGGMQWKTVNGAEYLTRYRQDPETGKKKFTSLGRRSDETERAHSDFLNRRDEAKHTVVAGRDAIAKAGRVAKAYGLARLPARTGEVIRGLSWRLFDQNIAIFGGAALLAFEADAGVLAPAGLIEDDGVIVLSLGQDLQPEQIGAAYTATVSDDAAVTRRRDRTIFRVPGFPPVEVWRPEFLLERLQYREERDVLASALSLPAVRGLTVARDGQPVEFRTLDIRAYAMAAQALGEDGDIWSERARCAVALSRRMDLSFTPEQEEVFPDLVDADAPQSPRI